MAQLVAPPVERQFLWNIFQSLDTDRSGSISAEELQRALSNGTWTPFNRETVGMMIGVFDRHHKGSVNFEEFQHLWKNINDWHYCFLSFDRDQSGSIDRHELATALRSFGYNISDNLIGLLLARFDVSGKGVILFDNFIRCCMILNMLTTTFREHDHDRDGYITLHYEEFLRLFFNFKLL